MRIRNTGLLIILVFAVASGAFAQAKTSTRNSGCASGTFTFKCPEGYKVLAAGKTEDRLFFAKNSEFGFGVFVVSEPGVSSVRDSLKSIIKLFAPKGSQEIEWKSVDADPRRSSKFELESKRQLGIDTAGKVLLTFEYRHIDFNGKRLLTGTIVDGSEWHDDLRGAFDNGRFTNNGGCFDSLDIIAAFTNEKLDPEKGPCFFEIVVTMDT